MGDKALILSADPWAMTAEDTGQKLAGNTVWFCNEYSRAVGDIAGLGFKPTKINATDEIYTQLKTTPLPALFDVEYGSRPGAGNKPALTIVGMKLIGVPNVWGKAVAPKVA